MALNGQIGQYEIVEILGSGAMGEVYRATDTKMFGRVVALKILSERLSQNEQACARFKREVEVASSLTHPHIVTIHDRGEHEGRPYFVMEYLEGTDLAELIRDHGSRTVEQRLEMARQIADALHFAHGHNVVHRDVKPSNIMLTQVSGSEQTKLVDFGIAHIERSSLTRATTQPGTFSYMSPEQLKNDALDHRSDLFSLGIVLYELFTGTHPFDAPSEALITTRILRDEPEPGRNRNSEVPPALDSLILKLLEKEPMQRPQTAGEVAEALRQILRKLQTKGVATDPSEYSNLDDLTRQMVENLLTWARQKEAEGALEEALKAYEKAHHLAPESERLKQKLPRLRHRIESDRKLRELLDKAREAMRQGRTGDAREHWRDAWILSPESEEVASLDREIETSERAAPEDRERKEFVESRMKRVEEALDSGRTDLARGPLVDILKRYPTETLAGLMLDRLMAITSSGIPYAEYRAALKEARGALGSGRFQDARAACGRAQEIWRGDEEALSLEREIASRVQGELSSLVARIEREIQGAEEPGRDEGRALENLRSALEALSRAADLGADAGWLRAAEEQAHRRRDEIEERRRARERQERERDEQRRKVVGSFLQRGRNLNHEAEALRRRGLPEAERAIEAYQQARSAYMKVLEEDPENLEALDAVRRIDAERTGLQKEIDAERGRRREAAGFASAARSALDRARAAAGGDENARRGSVSLVEEGLGAVRKSLDLVPDLDEALEAQRGLESLGKELREEEARREAARKETLARRQTAIDAALGEGRKLLAAIEPLVSGDVDDLARAEEIGVAAEAAYGKALALDPGHAEAGEARKVLASYLEHARSEAQRRRKEMGEREREEAEARARLAKEDDERKERARREAEAAEAARRERLDAERAGRLQGALSAARDLVKQVESLSGKAGDEGDRLLAILDRAKASTRELLELDPEGAEARKLSQRVESLAARAAPAVEKGRRRAELKEVLDRIEKARGLAAERKHKEALAILVDLDRGCRPYEWLHEAMPEIERLRAASAAEVGRGRRKLAIFGAAGAAVVLLAVAGIALLSGGGTRDAGSGAAAGRSRSETSLPQVSEARPPSSPAGTSPETGGARGSVSPTPEVHDVKEPGPPAVNVAPSARARPQEGEPMIAPSPRGASARPDAARSAGGETAPPSGTRPSAPKPEPPVGTSPGTTTPPQTAVPPPSVPPVERTPQVAPAERLPPVATTRFEGRIYVDEKPVGGGYRVVFRNLSEGGRPIESGATSADGRYTREVVLGNLYVVERVLGPGDATFEPKSAVKRPALSQGGPTVWDIKVYSRRP